MTAGLRVTPVGAGTWTVSDSRTRASFTVGHFRGSVTGTIAVTWGEVVVDAAGAPVRARAELDLGSVDTGIAKRDADLCKPHLLDATRRPVMTWSAERFTRDPDGSWTADGVLALRGTSVPLAVRATADQGHPESGRMRIRGTAALDRRSVGIRAPGFVIGRRVEVAVEAWLAPAH